MATSLFVLFREYADQCHSPSAHYIQCVEECNANAQLAFCEKWFKIIRFFKYEKCDRFYDSMNVESMLYPYQLLKNEYAIQEDEYPSLAYYVYTELKSEGFMNWRDDCNESIEECQRFIYNGLDVTHDSLGEILRVKMSNSAILLNCDALRCSSQVDIYSNDRQSYYIDCVKDIPSLHQWFSNNRSPQRQFDYNPKHGDKYNIAEYIPGTTRRAAQLETTCEEAQKLLEYAISTDPTKAFWYYDKVVGKYIYFENQQEIRLAFHGYHLSPGEENFDNIDRAKIDKVYQ